MTTLAELPMRLESAGYVRDFLAQVAAMTPADAGVDPEKLEILTQQVTPANTLARVFYMGWAVAREDLETLLSAPLCAELAREGLLVDAGEGQVKATCAVVPARDFWGLRDFESWASGQPVASDHVLGAGIASALLADLTVRRQGERVLDLGAGQGFQAAMAAKHAAHVVGTDINARALRFAQLAMRINGIGNVEFREGSMFEPVAGEKFDLVVSNPPFVIAPPHDLTVMGGRWVGDSFVEQLVTQTPEHLAENGWATIIGNWHHPTAADWAGRPTAWLANRGVDAWIVKLKTDDPQIYAENWLRESASPGRRAAMIEARSQLPKWIEYYHSLNVGAISMGVFYLRKRTLGAAGEQAVPHWVRTDAMDLQHFSGPASAQVQRIFAGETLLRGMKMTSEFLDYRLAACDSTELIQHLQPQAGTWQIREALVKQVRGFGFPTTIGGLPATILTRLSGQRTARDVIGDLARQMGADPAVAFERTAPFLAEMVRMGHVEVVGA